MDERAFDGNVWKQTVGHVLTLSELVASTGLPRSTVQFYVRQGLLPQPAKTESGRCLYSQNHVELLKRIRELRVRGYSVADIKDELEHLLEVDCESDPALVSRENEQVHQIILRVAVEEFVRKGYDRAHLASIIRRANVTPHTFRTHFPSKAQLLMASFNAFVRWNEELVRPDVERTSDPSERLLYRLTGNLRARALAADAHMVLRLEEPRKGGVLRQPMEDAWSKIVRPVATELAALRSPTCLPSVPDELIVLALSGAFDATYMRSLWDDTYTSADLLSAHLWLFLAVQAAIRGEIDIGSRMNEYASLIDEVAAASMDIPPSFELHGYEKTRGKILHAATLEFIARGFEGAHVSLIAQEAGVTPQVFYAHFPSKARLLAECFRASVEWNAALVEPRVLRSHDPAEKHLHRLTSTLRTRALGADALAFVRAEGMRKESDLREPLREAWDSVVGRFGEDLAAMRTGPAPPAVNDELVAFSLLGAFDVSYGRMLWDDVYTLDDVLSTNIWLFLAVQAGIRGEVELDSRLQQYTHLIEEIAGRDLRVEALFQSDDELRLSSSHS